MKRDRFRMDRTSNGKVGYHHTALGTQSIWLDIDFEYIGKEKYKLLDLKLLHKYLTTVGPFHINLTISTS